MFVGTIGTLVFIKNDVLKLKLICAFFVLSISLAYLGAVIKLSQTTFFLILVGALVMAGFS
ncbi:hypothetical protein [Salegentibacter salegens]|uniref:hypothetical protein n=1 Tax=Salegentibacter salegens TaxID=143223 RepID=UPI002012F574|nr:hypothetical protein [Salegentibacter salegens]